MARNEEYIDDMVSFVDLISFKDDLSDTSTVRNSTILIGTAVSRATVIYPSALLLDVLGNAFGSEILDLLLSIG